METRQRVQAKARCDDEVRPLLAILAVVLGAVLLIAYALWDLAADRLLTAFGCAVVRILTFGRVRLSSDTDYSRAMGIAAITLIAIFVAFALIASRVH
jgi:hypothetical protein